MPAKEEQPLQQKQPVKRKFRHEQKYYITRTEYELISRKLALTMDRDRFALKSGKYFIRSLYFDDYMNSAIEEKLAGNDDRSKYRIRIYNMKDTVIKFERKSKTGAFIEKRSIPLSRAECDAILRGQYGVLLRRREPFAKELYAAFRLRALKPCVLVDYWREAYVFPLEDVRVTFDTDIRTAHRSTDLFSTSLPTYPSTETAGDIVMEVKFNRFLPGYIRALIQPAANAQRSAISKYCLSRKYE